MKIVRVAGTSMWPTLGHNDFVVSLGTPERIQIGDVVILEHADLGTIVKRVCADHRDGTFSVSGDNPQSTDSAAIGRVARGAFVAIARWRVSPRGISRIR